MRENRKYIPVGVCSIQNDKCKAVVHYDFENFRGDVVIGNHNCPAVGKTCALSFFNSSIINAEVVAEKCEWVEMLQKPK